MTEGDPPVLRRGWLKNGNPPGDFRKAPRCGAKTRRGTPCQAPAMANGRCRMHGGKSTGPRTPEGLERLRQAKTKHGYYAAEAIRFRRMLNLLCQRAKEHIQRLTDSLPE